MGKINTKDIVGHSEQRRDEHQMVDAPPDTRFRDDPVVPANKTMVPVKDVEAPH